MSDSEKTPTPVGEDGFEREPDTDHMDPWEWFGTGSDD